MSKALKKLKKQLKKLRKRRLLISYFGYDRNYKNGMLRTVNGRQDAKAWKRRLGTIGRSKNAFLPMRAEDGNHKNFAFVYRNDVYALFVSVTTAAVPNGGGLKTVKTRLTLCSVPKKSSRNSVVLARDITLMIKNPDPDADTDIEVKMNPSALAQKNGILYLIDYDTKLIYRIEANELNGLTDGEEHTLTLDPVDLGAIAPGIGQYARGTAIGAATSPPGPDNTDGVDYLFALYNNPENGDPYEGYDDSVLVRLVIDEDGGLDYDAEVTMGKNTPGFSIMTPDTRVPYIVAVSIGGKITGGSTNGAASKIMSVPAFGDWSGGATTLLTGVLDGKENKFYDMFDMACSPFVDSNGYVEIVTGYYDTDQFTGLKWRFFKTTIGMLLNAQNIDLEGAIESGILTELEAGETLTPALAQDESSYGVYFLASLFEAGDTSAESRVWRFRGTELLVTLADKYGSPGKPGNPYRLFKLGYGAWDVGGENVQSAEMIIELIRQVTEGVAYKRGATAIQVPMQAAEEEEEEEEEK
ncbi:MAG: hypothetical protein LBD86_03210 [Spirochaetaceae bacterium]|jgi:hypothetical protein|nr:hypothetical protein [Spirochaetaceae bacterium]